MHYGVLGMKWGVRKYQNEDGTLTPEGEKRYKEEQKNIKKSVSNYTSKGLSKSEAEIKTLNDIRQKQILKTLAIVGGVSIGVAGAVVAKKAYNVRVDKVIKSGTTLQRMTVADAKDYLNRPFYAAYKKADMKKYEGLYGNQLAGGLFGDIEKDVNKVLLKANQNIRIASQKNATKTFKTLYDKDADFKNFVDDSLKWYLPKNDAKRYEYFNAAFVNSKGNSQAASQYRKFFNALKKQGYDGIEDINDMKIGNYRSKNPLIIFNNKNNKIQADKTFRQTEDVISKNFERERKKWERNDAARRLAVSNGPTALVSAGIISGAITGNSKAVDSYRKLHPNTKMTDRQILEMLEKSNKKK